jgi:hypothetical protein
MAAATAYWGGPDAAAIFRYSNLGAAPRDVGAAITVDLDTKFGPSHRANRAADFASPPSDRA